MARQQLDSLESKRQQFYKDGKQVVFREQAEKAVKAILSIKEVVSAAISAEPHTSVVWARVLIILPVGSQVRLSVLLLTLIDPRRHVTIRCRRHGLQGLEHASRILLHFGYIERDPGSIGRSCLIPGKTA